MGLHWWCQGRFALVHSYDVDWDTGSIRITSAKLRHSFATLNPTNIGLKWAKYLQILGALLSAKNYWMWQIPKLAWVKAGQGSFRQYRLHLSSTHESHFGQIAECSDKCCASGSVPYFALPQTSTTLSESYTKLLQHPRPAGLFVAAPCGTALAWELTFCLAKNVLLYDRKGCNFTNFNGTSAYSMITASPCT